MKYPTKKHVFEKAKVAVCVCGSPPMGLSAVGLCGLVRAHVLFYFSPRSATVRGYHLRQALKPELQCVYAVISCRARGWAGWDAARRGQL